MKMAVHLNVIELCREKRYNK